MHAKIVKKEAINFKTKRRGIYKSVWVKEREWKECCN